MTAYRTAALLVAAGRGERFGNDLPKQFHSIGRRTVLQEAATRFVEHPGIDLVCVVVAPDMLERARAQLPDPSMHIVAGAESRQESVLAGLNELSKENIYNILISDAVRPLVPGVVITRVLDSLSSHIAVLPAIPVVDTLKRRDQDGHLATVDRRGLWRAQTPQGFRFDAIHSAHRLAAKRGLAMTDDAAVAEAEGLHVALVEGDERAFKITLPEDLARARALLEIQTDGSMMEARTGTGFDVHRVGPGDGVTLCCVRLPTPFALVGHSDADVGAHAATDALLGAIGAGDIGAHFSPTDPAWRGAASDQFLAHASGLVRAAGGRIVNLDVTLICERPKIGPHRVAMRAALAKALGIEPMRVSVKATTSEGLGFAGRGEGIAAQAVASVELPRSGE